LHSGQSKAFVAGEIIPCLSLPGTHVTALSSTEGISPVHHRAVVRVQTLGSGALERLQTPRSSATNSSEQPRGARATERPCHHQPQVQPLFVVGVIIQCLAIGVTRATVQLNIGVTITVRRMAARTLQAPSGSGDLLHPGQMKKRIVRACPKLQHGVLDETAIAAD